LSISYAFEVPYISDCWMLIKLQKCTVYFTLKLQVFLHTTSWADDVCSADRGITNARVSKEKMVYEIIIEAV
jgi:hypothetical protein